MKHLFFALLYFFATVATAQTLSEYPDFERYQKDNERIIQNKTYPKVIFIGNSITDGWASKRPVFFTGHQFLGRGISGQTSPQLLLRFQKDVIDLKPKAVVINIGTNDIAENTGKYSIEYTVSNIKSMVELAKSHKIKVYLSSVLPVDVYPWRKDITDAVKQIYELNVRIRQLAKAKLLQKSEMRKNMVMDLIYRGFINAANYSESHYNPRRSQIKTELRYLFVTTPNR